MVTETDSREGLLKNCAKALLYLGQDGPHRRMLESTEVETIAKGRKNFLERLQENSVHKASELGGSHLIENTEAEAILQIKHLIKSVQRIGRKIDIEDLDHQLLGTIAAYRALADELQGDTTQEGIAAASYAAEVETCLESIRQNAHSIDNPRGAAISGSSAKGRHDDRHGGGNRGSAPPRKGR